MPKEKGGFKAKAKVSGSSGSGSIGSIGRSGSRRLRFTGTAPGAPGAPGAGTIGTGTGPRKEPIPIEGVAPGSVIQMAKIHAGQNVTVLTKLPTPTTSLISPNQVTVVQKLNGAPKTKDVGAATNAGPGKKKAKNLGQSQVSKKGAPLTPEQMASRNAGIKKTQKRKAEAAAGTVVASSATVADASASTPKLNVNQKVTTVTANAAKTVENVLHASKIVAEIAGPPKLETGPPKTEGEVTKTEAGPEIVEAGPEKIVVAGAEGPEKIVQAASETTTEPEKIVVNTKLVTTPETVVTTPEVEGPPKTETVVAGQEAGPPKLVTTPVVTPAEAGNTPPVPAGNKIPETTVPEVGTPVVNTKLVTEVEGNTTAVAGNKPPPPGGQGGPPVPVPAEGNSGQKPPGPEVAVGKLAKLKQQRVAKAEAEAAAVKELNDVLNKAEGPKLTLGGVTKTSRTINNKTTPAITQTATTANLSASKKTRKVQTPEDAKTAVNVLTNKIAALTSSKQQLSESNTRQLAKLTSSLAAQQKIINNANTPGPGKENAGNSGKKITETTPVAGQEVAGNTKLVTTPAGNQSLTKEAADAAAAPQKPSNNKNNLDLMGQINKAAAAPLQPKQPVPVPGPPSGPGNQPPSGQGNQPPASGPGNKPGPPVPPVLPVPVPVPVPVPGQGQGQGGPSSGPAGQGNAGPAGQGNAGNAGPAGQGNAPPGGQGNAGPAGPQIPKKTKKYKPPKTYQWKEFKGSKLRTKRRTGFFGRLRDKFISKRQKQKYAIINAKNKNAEAKFNAEIFKTDSKAQELQQKMAEENFIKGQTQKAARIIDYGLTEKLRANSAESKKVKQGLGSEITNAMFRRYREQNDIEAEKVKSERHPEITKARREREKDEKRAEMNAPKREKERLKKEKQKQKAFQKNYQTARLALMMPYNRNKYRLGLTPNTSDYITPEKIMAQMRKMEFDVN